VSKLGPTKPGTPKLAHYTNPSSNPNTNPSSYLTLSLCPTLILNPNPMPMPSSIPNINP